MNTNSVTSKLNASLLRGICSYKISDQFCHLRLLYKVYNEHLTLYAITKSIE